MQLGGYQKLTLMDYPGCVAAICFTKGCQLKCPYCHNAGLVLAEGQDGYSDAKEVTSDFLSYLEKRKKLLTGVVVSGGEPLLQEDIMDFLHALKGMGFKVKLDTNGLLTQRLSDVLDQGLADYVAMDFKNCRQYWAGTVGLGQQQDPVITDKLYESWQASLSCLRQNQVDYELRTTVVRELHPPDALRRMAETIQSGTQGGKEKWFLQPFRRSGTIISDYMNSEGNQLLSAYSTEEMEAILRELRRYVPGIQLRG